MNIKISLRNTSNGGFMLKKNWFYLFLFTIYILYLAKDTLMGFFISLDPNLINNTYTNMINQNLEEENHELKKLYQLEEQYPELIFSKVLIRDIYYFNDKITIAKGLNHHIKDGDIVINEEGLVGIIKKSYHNYSEVELITNPNINLSIKINDSYGILTSRDKKLTIQNMKLNQEIKPGDIVSTSGLTGIPANIYVGEVESVYKDNLELEYILELKNRDSLEQLKYVGVISI